MPGLYAETTIQKFEDRIFSVVCFWKKSLMLTKAALFDEKYSTII